MLAGLVGLLLTAYWVLATSAVVVTLLPLPLPQAFKDAVRLSAARGKLWSTRPKSLGLLNDLAVPQAWFSHFYAVGTACCAFLVLLATPAPAGRSEGQRQSPVFLSYAEAIQYISLWLFLLHLLRRLLETCFLMVYPPAARMHIIAYLFGLSYYIVAPLSLLSCAQYGHAANQQDLVGVRGEGLMDKGIFMGWRAFVASRVAFAPAALVSALAQAGTWQSRLQVALGLGIIFMGFALQLHSHWVLAALAAKGISSGPESFTGDKGGHKSQKLILGEFSSAYCIPYGGAFEWVSCPHYAAEVVIYAGFTTLTWPHAVPNVPLMLVWVLVNLVLAAGATQQWYYAKFPSYPRTRRALIPGLF